MFRIFNRWRGYALLKRSGGWLLQKRFLFALLGFLGISNVYAMRVNLSVALVAMVYTPPTANDFDEQVTCVDLLKEDPRGIHNLTHPTMATNQFYWNSQEQSMILGSFFYGYIVTQIPGGIVAEKHGAKWLFGIGVLVTSVFTLLTPMAARWGFWPLVMARAIEGLGEGVTYPSMYALIGRWSPKMERSRTAAIVFSGSSIGTVVSMAVSGILSAAYGWEWVFYLFGALGVAWCVPWLWLVHESPETHPSITRKERAHILKGQDEKRAAGGGTPSPTPWRSILSSGSVWSLAITHFGQGWGFYTLLTEMPTYLSNILHFDLRQNGLVSAVPYLVQALFSISASVLADRIRASGRFTITTIRKIFNTFAFFLPGLFVFLVGFVGCRPALIVVLLTLSVGFNGLIHSGFSVTHVDMSPAFAGTLMGITNCISNFSGFLAPAYVGYIIKSGQTLENWKHVFVTTSTVFCISGVVFNVFGTAEPQPWGGRPPPSPAPPPPPIDSAASDSDSVARALLVDSPR